MCWWMYIYSHQIFDVDDVLDVVVAIDMVNDEFDCVSWHLQMVFDEVKILVKMF